MDEPKWARVRYPKIDYPGHLLFRRAEDPAPAPKSLDEVDPELLRTYAKLGIPLIEQEILAGVERPNVAVDAVFDSVSVATTFKAELAKAGVIFCSFSEAVAKPSGTRAPLSRHGRADHRQLLRDAELGRVLRRLVRLCAAGRALPDGAFDLFSHQREEHRPVRAHADHRRQGLLCQLSRRLHGAQARREPASRRRCRTDRARRRRDQIFDGAELVSGRRRGARAASTISSPSAAIAAARGRKSPGRRSRPARRSPGNIRPASCAAMPRAANSIRSPFPTAISRSTAAPR